MYLWFNLSTTGAHCYTDNFADNKWKLNHYHNPDEVIVKAVVSEKYNTIFCIFLQHSIKFCNIL